MDQAQTAQGVVYGRVERIHCRDKDGYLLPTRKRNAIVHTNSGEVYIACFKDIKNLFDSGHYPLQPDVILRGVPRGNRLYDVEVA